MGSPAHSMPDKGLYQSQRNESGKCESKGARKKREASEMAAIKEAIRSYGGTIREVFNSIDVNGDKAISRHEFRMAMAEVTEGEMPKNEKDELIMLIDQDNNNMISLDELH